MTVSEALRTFIAIELGPQVQKTLGAVQEQLRKADADIRWVKPGNIHLTLKFLGEISVKKIKAVSESFPSIFSAFHAFDIAVPHLGVFPGKGNPRVLWAGIEQGAAQATAIAQAVEDYLAKLGFPKERKEFVPHITLGRVRSKRNLPALQAALNDFVFPQPCRGRVSAVTLFKSTLTPQGSIYEPLIEARLA